MLEPLTRAQLLKRLLEMHEAGIPLNERLNFAKLYATKKRRKK